jgi:hypothetical protein
VLKIIRIRIWIRKRRILANEVHERSSFGWCLRLLHWHIPLSFKSPFVLNNLNCHKGGFSFFHN